MTPAAPTKASSIFRMATRPGTRSVFSKDLCALERGVNDFAVPERDEPSLAVFILNGAADTAPLPLRGTYGSAMGISGTCSVTGASEDGLCSGLEGGEPRIASIDANGLSGMSDGARAWKAFPGVFFVTFAKLLGSSVWPKRGNRKEDNVRHV
jgi:hypothetical protein